MGSCRSRKKIKPAIFICAVMLFCFLGRGCGNAPSSQTSASIDSPVRISAAATNDDITVSDYYLQKILLVNKTDLSIKTAFSIAGKPTAVAFRNGLFYVGNETTGSVEIYNSAGVKQGDLGGVAGTIKMPQDIAFDEADQRIFVVDGFARIVKTFDFNGNAQGTLPAGGFNRDILAFPTGISVDPDANQVFVSDYGDMSAFPTIKPKIQVFDYSGAVIRTLVGASGGFVPVFTFSRPQGSVLDPTYVFVVDSLLGQVLVINRLTGGAPVKTLGSFGSANGQLLLPTDIYMDNATKDIYVTDNRNQRISVFRGGGTVP